MIPQWDHPGIWLRHPITPRIGAWLQGPEEGSLPATASDSDALSIATICVLLLAAAYLSAATLLAAFYAGRATAIAEKVRTALVGLAAAPALGTLFFGVQLWSSQNRTPLRPWVHGAMVVAALACALAALCSFVRAEFRVVVEATCLIAAALVAESAGLVGTSLPPPAVVCSAVLALAYLAVRCGEDPSAADRHMGAAPMIAALALTARLHALEQDPDGTGLPPEEVVTSFVVMTVSLLP